MNFHTAFPNVSKVISHLNSLSGLPISTTLPAERIYEALDEINAGEQTKIFRKRRFSLELTLWTFLSQVLSEDQSCQNAVVRLIAFLTKLGQPTPSANTAAYCKARQRVPEALLSKLTRETGQELQSLAARKWRWHDRSVKLLDGSSLSMPDTKANQAAYPQTRMQKPGIGFPVVQIVALVSHSTGALLDLATGPVRGSSEHKLFRQLLPRLSARDLVVADCFYSSYWLMAELIERNVDFLFPKHQGRICDFSEGTCRDKDDHVIQLYRPYRPTGMDKAVYNTYPKQITIREVRVQIKRKGGADRTKIFSTSLLDEDISKASIAEIYRQRWRIEIDLLEIKQTMKMDILRGKTPAMVRREIWAHLLAYNLLRKVMVEAALQSGKSVQDLSFKLTLQVTTSFAQAGLLDPINAQTYADMLNRIAHKCVGNRPGRHEPRRVKRRPKRFSRLCKPRSFYRSTA